MLGREAPLDFFRRSGLPIAGEGTSRGWIALGLFIAFCVFLYFWKSGGFAETWLDPWPGKHASLLSSLGGWLQTQIADRATLLGTLAVSLKSRSFYYTLLYSYRDRRLRHRTDPAAQDSVRHAANDCAHAGAGDSAFPAAGNHSAVSRLQRLVRSGFGQNDRGSTLRILHSRAQYLAHNGRIGDTRALTGAPTASFSPGR